MVLKHLAYTHFIRIGVLLLLLLPVAAGAQSLKYNAYDKFKKQWRTESLPVPLKATEDTKLAISLLSVDTSFYLYLIGSGIGTSTVDVGSEAVFTLDNGLTVVAKSEAVQSFDYSQLTPSYRHEYVLYYKDLEELSRYSIRSIRKYAAGGFDDIVIDRGQEANLKVLSTFFINQLREANRLPKAAPDRPAGFPGGKQVMLSFLNRNLKSFTEMRTGEKKEAVVQFRVMDDGTVSDLQVKQSAGALLDTELLRILKRMPKWKPAIENGKLVAAVITQPVSFLRTDTAMVIEL